MPFVWLSIKPPEPEDAPPRISNDPDVVFKFAPDPLAINNNPEVPWYSPFDRRAAWIISPRDTTPDRPPTDLDSEICLDA